MPVMNPEKCQMEFCREEATTRVYVQGLWLAMCAEHAKEFRR